MKKFLQIVLVVLLVGLIFAGVAGALSSSPQDIVVYRIEDRIGLFQRPDGAWCTVEYHGELYEPEIDCDCPCEVETVYEECEKCEPEIVELPCKEKNPKCNSGRGNDSEGDPDCDPGNSGGHNQGGD